MFAWTYAWLWMRVCLYGECVVFVCVSCYVYMVLVCVCVGVWMFVNACAYMVVLLC